MTTPLPSQGVFHAFRLGPGENLVEGLRRAFEVAQSEAMAIVTCVGSLTEVVIRHADRPDPQTYRGRFEITSLVGTIDPNGQHLHIAIADPDGRSYGGHLMAEGSAIYTTAEIVTLALTELVFSREPCPASGYRELVVRQTRHTG
ncbi:DUF296 domain-containing protein [Paracoccus sp. MBLB3053]|uniref:DUF296 domain-containing protein n=1 Tax=Paracoccus aurantius TaxID=3073814 RepID=A0ABU2HV87_9RHOB|nr:DUF296 domain-containing protein [Paracoccus sp. MBLB3053]MDS9468953.1 DUF296 domain-containing protein [Paracoccus sp. MBLB3053]